MSKQNQQGTNMNNNSVVPVGEVWTTSRYIFKNGCTVVFENYEVSSMGRVKSLNYNRTGKARVMSPGTIKAKDGSIWHQVILFKDNKRYYIAVHRLVLSSFKEGDYFPGAVVDHIVARTETDCCDRLDNLRWFTAQQNRTTEHCKELQSKQHTNRKDLSKRVRITNLTTGEAVIYSSAREAERSLSLPLNTISFRIRKHKSYYKKLNLHFEYTD